LLRLFDARLATLAGLARLAALDRSLALAARAFAGRR
jgi:hypothetical protein